MPASAQRYDYMLKMQDALRELAKLTVYGGGGPGEPLARGYFEDDLRARS